MPSVMRASVNDDVAGTVGVLGVVVTVRLSNAITANELDGVTVKLVTGVADE
jgi:hypothetical protein